jgi:inosose dehydratase
MSFNLYTRRRFLENAAILGGAALLAKPIIAQARAQVRGKLHVACNSYTWQTSYARENRSFNASLDAGLEDVAKSGLDGFEPLVTSPQEIDKLVPLLKKHGLEMRSLYVNSVLHKPEAVEASISEIMTIVEKAKPAGTRLIVTNPSPIRWGGPENKDDAQLKLQAEALDKLGAKLRSMDLTLAYHNHDIELRNAAREFHHMMLGTDPKNVALCLDAHWIYRGSGRSSVALFDLLKVYGLRVREVHLRQSVRNIWSETFGEGDIDYVAFAQRLMDMGVKPHLVLEQAPENGTPKTMGPVEAHRASVECVRRVFAAFASSTSG